MKQLHELFNVESVKCLARAETSRTEVSVLFVVSLLAEPDLDVVEDVTPQSLKRLNEDVD